MLVPSLAFASVKRCRAVPHCRISSLTWIPFRLWVRRKSTLSSSSSSYSSYYSSSSPAATPPTKKNPTTTHTPAGPVLRVTRVRTSNLRNLTNRAHRDIRSTWYGFPVITAFEFLELIIYILGWTGDRGAEWQVSSPDLLDFRCGCCSCRTSGYLGFPETSTGFRLKCLFSCFDGMPLVLLALIEDFSTRSLYE
jgi:hypothetical protein